MRPTLRPAGSIDAGAFNENIKIKMQIKPGKRKHLNLTHNCPGNGAGMTVARKEFKNDSVSLWFRVSK